MNDYLAKPISRDELLQKLTQWLLHPQQTMKMANSVPTAFNSPAVLTRPSPRKTVPHDFTPASTTTLPVIDGLDTVAALGRIGDDKPLDESLLGKFYSNWAGAIRVIRQALENAECATAELRLRQARRARTGLSTEHWPGAVAALIGPATHIPLDSNAVTDALLNEAHIISHSLHNRFGLE